MNKSIEKQKGFGLIEISLILALAGAAVLSWEITSGQNQQQRIQQQQSALKSADAYLMGFIQTNSRLPCPDSDSDGLENCDVAKGTLPYKTLGLVAEGFRPGELQIRYGVYRNNILPNGDADLAAVTDRFQLSPTVIPEDSGGVKALNAKTGAFATIFSSYDFCSALLNGSNAGVSTEFTFVENDDSERFNVAYALTTPGMANADGKHGIFDGLNSQDNAGFEMPGRLHRPYQYDDLVITRGFGELYRKLHCDLGLAVANMVNTSSDVYNYNDDEFDNLKGNVELALDMAITGVTMGVVNTANNVVQSIWSAKELAISSALLASATASCAVVVGCVLIPVYSTSLAFSTTGIITSAISIALDITSVGLESAALDYYKKIAQKAGVALEQSSYSIRATEQLDVIALLEGQQQELINGNPEVNQNYPCIREVSGPDGSTVNDYTHCSYKELSHLSGFHAAEERYQRIEDSSHEVEQKVESSITDFVSIANAIGAFPDKTGEVVSFPTVLLSEVESYLQKDATYTAEAMKLEKLNAECNACPTPNLSGKRVATYIDENGQEKEATFVDENGEVQKIWVEYEACKPEGQTPDICLERDKQLRIVNENQDSRNLLLQTLKTTKQSMLDITGDFEVCIARKPRPENPLPQKCTRPDHCKNIKMCNLRELLDNRFPEQEQYPIEGHIFFQLYRYQLALEEAASDMNTYLISLQNNKFMLFKARCENDGRVPVEVDVPIPGGGDSMTFDSRTYQCQTVPVFPPQEPSREVEYPEDILTIIDEVGVTRKIRL